VGIAFVGVVISLYYYFGIIRAIYWSKDATDLSPVEVSLPARILLLVCVAGMLFLGLFPGAIVDHTAEVAQVLNVKSPLAPAHKLPHQVALTLPASAQP
jgi:NADH:ubiquinone oxidoreductase subunit 2 (subunit N)